MRKLVFVTAVFVIAAIFSCVDNGRHGDFAAANAAKDYYDRLIHGDCEDFVRGMNLPERVPRDYWDQLVDNARMFVAEQQEHHGGLREVRVVNCVNDSVQSVATAFLLLSFGDNTIEQVAVPMVKRNGKWYMK